MESDNMIDIDRVLERLNFMTKRLNRLKSLEFVSLETYLDDLDSQLIAERILELIIQAAIDINNHIIKQGLKLEAVGPKESFLILRECQILSEELAQQLSKSAIFRNILAHEYLDIDDNIVFNLIPKALKQYPLYVLQIQQYLNSLENDINE